MIIKPSQNYSKMELQAEPPCQRAEVDGTTCQGRQVEKVADSVEHPEPLAELPDLCVRGLSLSSTLMFRRASQENPKAITTKLENVSISHTGTCIYIHTHIHICMHTDRRGKYIVSRKPNPNTFPRAMCWSLLYVACIDREYRYCCPSTWLLLFLPRERNGCDSTPSLPRRRKKNNTQHEMISAAFMYSHL